MDEGSEQIFDYIFGLIMGLFAISATVAVFAAGSRWNDTFAAQMGNKASIIYSLAYSEESYLISATDAYTDILQEDSSVSIFIDGLLLDPAQLEKARNKNAEGLHQLRLLLNKSSYKKVLYYDSAGQVIKINYVGE